MPFKKEKSHKTKGGYITPDKMRVANYRGDQMPVQGNRSVDSLKGRIGIPMRPDIPQRGNEIAFADLVMAGLKENSGGGRTGFGVWLTEHAREDEAHIGATRLPSGAADVAEQDLYMEGTPGKGVELVEGEEYSSVSAVASKRLIARKTLAQMEEDLVLLKQRFAELLYEAQTLENSGDQVRAGLYDRRAIALKTRIARLEQTIIPTRRRYENQVMEEDYSTGMRFE